jgi:hypothetical protein
MARMVELAALAAALDNIRAAHLGRALPDKETTAARRAAQTDTARLEVEVREQLAATHQASMRKRAVRVA